MMPKVMFPYGHGRMEYEFPEEGFLGSLRCILMSQRERRKNWWSGRCGYPWAVRRCMCWHRGKGALSFL